MNGKIVLGLLAVMPLILGGCTNKCNLETGKANMSVLENSNRATKLKQSGKDNVYFGYNKYNLTKDAKAIVKEQSSYIDPNDRVVVEGRTDERGTAEYNRALSEKRANAVRQELIKNDVNANNISVVAYGKDSPIGDKSEYRDKRKWWAINRVATTSIDAAQ